MELDEYGIADLQGRFARGEWTSLGLCEAFLRRIAAIDQAGPTLRAVVEPNPDALAIAAERDRERQAGGPCGPLHGVPILVKESMDTGDRMMTTAGSLALEGHVAAHDAFIVRRLRAAGAVVLAKTNMSEWGYLRSARACSGWSSRGGQTRNPYVLDRTPCGSSSGSAAGVAANLATAALGAETDGSIVHPASMNGIVGIKPTVGLVSRAGIVPAIHTQDVAGPLARTVADAATLLTVIAGHDPADPDTAGRDPVDYRTCLDADGLRGARVGVARDYFRFHEGTDAVLEEAVRALASCGATIVDPVQFDQVVLFGPAELEIALYEFKAGLNAYLAAHPTAPVRSLEELIRANEALADRVMPYFAQELLEAALCKGGLHEPAYRAAKAECLRMSRTDGIDKALRAHRLDAIVAPTDGTPPWVIDPVVGDKILGGCSSPPAMAGYPHITVPAGYVHGLPVGMSLFAGPWAEGTLIRLAYAFEQATRVRARPTFHPSVGA